MALSASACFILIPESNTEPNGSTNGLNWNRLRLEGQGMAEYPDSKPNKR